MLVKLIPGLEKYAMDSSNVTLLLLVVLATIVIKDIFEQKKLLKEYEAFWIYPIISAILLIGIALSPDIVSDLFMILELFYSVKMGALQYELNKKSRNRMGSCTIYILILPDNTVIVEKPMYENEMQLSGVYFIIQNPRNMKHMEPYWMKHLRMSEMMIQNYIKRSWIMNRLMRRIVHCHACGKVIFQRNMMSCSNT